MLITLIRHIDATRQIVSNFQVGVRLLNALQYSLMFPTFSHVGMFSPLLLSALAERNEKVLQFYGRAYRYQAYAANLCYSLRRRSYGRYALAGDGRSGGRGGRFGQQIRN